MNALAAITTVSIRQLLLRRRTIGLLLLVLFPAVVQLLGGSDPSTTEEVLFYRGTLQVVMSVTMPIVALVIATGALGDERRDDTLSFIMLRPIRRELIVGAKLLAAWAAAFLVTAVGAVAAALAFGFTSGSFGEIVPALAGAAVGSLAYVAVFLPLGYLTERAIIAGLGFVLVWENIIGNAIEAMSSTSLWRIGGAAYAGLSSDSIDTIGLQRELVDMLGRVTPGFWGATAKALVLSAASVALITYLVRQRDLV